MAQKLGHRIHEDHERHRFPVAELAELEEFVGPHYSRKDSMHDLSHIRRFLRVALSLSARYPSDERTIVYGAYFHGVDRLRYRRNLVRFMRAHGLHVKEIRKVFQAASESQKESSPASIEGKILHDSHLVEGGRTFIVVKCLMTGLFRGSSLRQIADQFEDNIDGRYRCSLPETRKTYAEMESFARRFFSSLGRSL